MAANLISFKIKLHSMVDVITNSSSVIYTYSDGSLPALKKLLGEMTKLFGVTEPLEDCFNIYVAPESWQLIERFDEWYSDLDEDEKKMYIGYDNMTDEQQKKYVIDLYRLNTENEKSEYWMGEDDEGVETWLYIEAKRPIYNKLGEALRDFLYSTRHEEGYN